MVSPRACSESTASDHDGDREDDQNRRDDERNSHAVGDCLGTRRRDVGRR